MLKMLRIFASILLMFNKSLTISILLDLTAKYNAVLLIYQNNCKNPINIINSKFYWNIWFIIPLKYFIFNCIERIHFKFHENIIFQMSLNYFILDSVEITHFK